MMQQPIQLFFSNKLELLYEELKTTLFVKKGPPFARRLVVVYGPAMKNWLTLRMAQDPTLGIAAGIEFIYLNETFPFLLSLFSPQKTTVFPSLIQMRFSIEQKIRSIINQYPHLTSDKQMVWDPLMEYLRVGQKESSSTKMERRLIGLSTELALLFQEYGRFGAPLIDRWKSSPSGWQENLWNLLFSPESTWSFPAKALRSYLYESPETLGADISIHFFSISFMTASEFAFLEKIASQTPIYHYLLSPCAVFWSDIRSDKEVAYLETFWEKKWGKNSPRLSELDLFLRDRNPLLANFGRLGREMALSIEESKAQTVACYHLPENILTLHPDANEIDDLYLTSPKNGTPLTLLQALQSDLLLMRNPSESPSFDIQEQLNSISLHAAPTQRREVEIIYHQLMHLFSKQTELTPSDVIVMTPQIKDYVPFIHAVFGGKESLFDYQILDLGIEGQSEIVQGFLHLFELSQGRWEASKILKLFNHSDFKRAHRLSSTDYDKIESWIDRLGIRWGDDLAHRNHILERRHCRQGMVESTNSGTWAHGFDLLIEGLTTLSDNQISLDFSHSDLLGKWMKILHGLKEDLAPLHDGTEMTVDDWANYFVCLVDSYFQINFDDSHSIDDFQNLKAQFEKLRSGGKYCKSSSFSFTSIKVEMIALLDHRGMTYRENSLQSIRFCSLMPLRSIPAKVIVMMGMHEGAFPRVSIPSSLNLMTGHDSIDYCPSTTDYDRYLFLEAIQSAKEYLLITYQSYSQEESKELQPSIAIQELLSYLNRFYTINGQSVNDQICYRHPFDSFDFHYFQGNPRFVNYSLSNFHAAQTLQQPVKNKPHGFLSEFACLIKDSYPFSKTEIDLKDLTALARNPIKFHLNRGLGIYLEKAEDRLIKNEEGVTLNALEKYQFKQAALRDSFESVMEKADKEGKLPFGLFKTVAKAKIKNDFTEIDTQLTHHSLSSSDFFDIEFSPSLAAPVQKEKNGWIFPSPIIEIEKGKPLSITGKLKYATSKGLIFFGKDHLSDSWKAWPSFLLYCHAASLAPDLLKPVLIPLYGNKTKPSFFKDPLPLLADFVNYYMLGLHSFSPLLPEWISFIMQEDNEGLKNKITQLFNPFGDFYQNEELLWILNQKLLPSTERLICDWKPQAEKIGGEMIQYWHPLKLSKQSVVHERI